MTRNKRKRETTIDVVLSKYHVTTTTIPPPPPPPPLVLPSTTAMPPASDEQMRIIHALAARPKQSVIVDAVAGSGKSTTVLHVAAAFSHLRILQLTYNAFLRKELKDKAAELGIDNIEIHTYHSFAVKYYSREAFTDFGLRKCVVSDKPPLSPYQYDIVVLDEVQDMTLLYYRFVRKCIRNMTTKSHHIHAESSYQMLFLGDFRQSLYEFKGSDARFLTMADQIWPEHSFVRAGLQTSYRITLPMSRFVNEIMLGQTRLLAPRNGPRVTYFRYNRRECAIKIVCEIQRLILEENAQPKDFFVLAGSLRGHGNFAKQLENELVERGIPCNVPMIENEAMDDRVIQGKIVFSSFHSVKGRQRPYVFVLGFSQSYVDRCSSSSSSANGDLLECPNTLYVACTRATKQLYVYEEDRSLYDGPCAFLKKSHRDMLTCKECTQFVQFVGAAKSTVFASAPQPPPSQQQQQLSEPAESNAKARIFTTVTDLVKFIPETSFDELAPIVENSFVLERAAFPVPLDVPVVHQCASTGHFEEISDINGIILPAMYFDSFRKQDTSSVAETVPFQSCIETVIAREMARKRALKQERSKIYGLLHQVIQTCQEKRGAAAAAAAVITPAEYLYLGNAYIALKENLFFKLNQIHPIHDYTWLQPSVVDQCFAVMHEAFGDNIIDEFQLEQTIIDAGAGEEDEVQQILDQQTKSAGLLRTFAITARVDLITSSCVFEIKCTSQLTMDHFLQLMLYAWIWRTVCHLKPKEFKLINIRTAERYRLVCDNNTLCRVAHILLKNKYTQLKPLPQEQFLDSCFA